MKHLAKFLGLLSLILALLGSTSVALAQEGSAQAARLVGLRGQVTAVGDASLTVETPGGERVTVNVTDDTKVLIARTGEGSLADIKVGDSLGVRGQRNDDGSIQARLIVIFSGDPRNLARVRGKVTEIDGNVIVVEGPSGSQRVTTNDRTKIRIGRTEASLDDLQAGDAVFALGTKQDDGAFIAQIVLVAVHEQTRGHLLRGQVSSVDTDAGTLTVEALRNNETWTIQTTDATQYHVPNVDNPTLSDVPVGAMVMVVGQKAGDGSNTGTARRIFVLPDRAQQGRSRASGQVTEIKGTSFTLQTSKQTELTILTDNTTQYRARGGGKAASFDDIEVGARVVVFGNRVEDQENTIEAKAVGIMPGEKTQN